MSIPGNMRSDGLELVVHGNCPSIVLFIPLSTKIPDTPIYDCDESSLVFTPVVPVSTSLDKLVILFVSTVSPLPDTHMNTQM
jgi:hypothetical protein